MGNDYHKTIIDIDAKEKRQRIKVFKEKVRHHKDILWEGGLISVLI